MQQKTHYKYLVMIDEFSPATIWHIQQIHEALTLSDKVVILIENSHLPRSTAHPWTFEVRKQLISVNFSQETLDRIVFVPLSRFMYSRDLWLEQTQHIVNAYAAQGTAALFTDKESLISDFPQWTIVRPSVPADIPELNNVLFAASLPGSNVTLDEFWPYVTSLTYANLQKNIMTAHFFADLVSEYAFIQDYKKAWKAAPYAVTFMTVDAIVIQSGHVLMVERGAFPGKGLLALPGGFLEQDETTLEGALRELEEETKIDVPKKVLRGNIVGEKLFDNVNRSQRGRTITNAFCIKLPNGRLPKVKGSDDAKRAMWVPFSSLDPEQIFEDHYDIIQYFIN